MKLKSGKEHVACLSDTKQSITEPGHRDGEFSHRINRLGEDLTPHGDVASGDSVPGGQGKKSTTDEPRMTHTQQGEM